MIPIRSKRRSKIALAFALILTFVAGTAADGLPMFDQPVTANGSLTDAPAYATFEEAWNLIQTEYVDPGNLDEDALLYGATRGMVEAVGDTGHTTFLDPEEARDYRMASDGNYVGLGIEFDFTLVRPQVIAPIEGSPADEAGVTAGDILTEIDGMPVDGLAYTELVATLRGEEGSSTALTFFRPTNDTTYTVEVTRRLIEVPLVSWAMLPNHVALVRLAEFSGGAGKALAEAFAAAKESGATSVVLDLRNNPGGLVSEVEQVANQLLSPGSVIYQYKENDTDPSLELTEVGPPVLDLPLAVLIDRGTASAAEIIAVAVKQNDRGTLVGETTFGTGTVLTPYELEDGSLLMLGTGLWLTPDGEQFWKVGVEPDLPVRNPLGTNPFRPRSGMDVDTASVFASGDQQVLTALNLLDPAGLWLPAAA